ncbi:MAG TPA: uracil-DNA glycosylase [Longimicrobiaceae bacterium]|nr:uracil-DNA glycosylase [Longimicrobiaceae bacterium]
MTAADHLLRRYLRQRRELGEHELVLDDLTPDLLVDALRVARPDSGPASDPDRADAAVECAAGATAPGPTVPELVQIGGLDELRNIALGCPLCRLSETRNHVVFGEGNPAADLVVVGEAPGADEDRTGRPFVGRAGKLLDLLLASVGFPRESVYICNVLKCRPPGNRNPQPDEIAACSPYLARQLELVAPRAILAVGTFPAQTLLSSTSPIGRLRGAAHDYQGTPLVATYHPAAVLRNPGWIRPVWEDLQRLRGILDRA